MVEEANLVVIVGGFDSMGFGREQAYEVCEPEVLTSATSCPLDQFDRPVVGFVNFCLCNSARRLEEDDTTSNSLPKVEMPNMIAESNVEFNQEGSVPDFDAILIVERNECDRCIITK